MQRLPPRIITLIFDYVHRSLIFDYVRRSKPSFDPLPLRLLCKSFSIATTHMQFYSIYNPKYPRKIGTTSKHYYWSDIYDHWSKRPHISYGGTDYTNKMYTDKCMESIKKHGSCRIASHYYNLEIVKLTPKQLQKRYDPLVRYKVFEELNIKAYMQQYGYMFILYMLGITKSRLGTVLSTVVSRERKICRDQHKVEDMNRMLKRKKCKLDTYLDDDVYKEWPKQKINKKIKARITKCIALKHVTKYDD